MRVEEKYYDEIFEFEGLWGMLSRCGLRVIRRDGRTVVVVTELYQDNPGTSVTAAGRLLATRICEAKGLTLGEITYLECNPDTNSKLSFYDEEYFEATFSDAPQAAYRRLERSEVMKLFND
jgi:hypothetical protein